MGKFIVFGFDGYYPSGGWDDFIADFSSIDDARAFVDVAKVERPHKRNGYKSGLNFYQIVDVSTGNVENVSNV